MKSYVRDSVKTLVFVSEHKRRCDVVRGGLYVRLTVEDMEILGLLAARFKISKTGSAQMVLGPAIRDAAEQLGLWKPEEDPTLSFEEGFD